MPPETGARILNPKKHAHQQTGRVAHHAEEMAAGQSFNYAIFEADERDLLGCVYIDQQAQPATAGATVSWWVVDHAVGSQLEAALADHVPCCRRWSSVRRQEHRMVITPGRAQRARHRCRARRRRYRA